jgi:hypothetical protein
VPTNNTKATVLGLIAAALIGTKIDWSLLLHGDPGQIGTAFGVVVAAVIGYYTNRPEKKTIPPPPSNPTA